MDSNACFNKAGLNELGFSQSGLSNPATVDDPQLETLNPKPETVHCSISFTIPNCLLPLTTPSSH
jgi:hypothetical protein